MSAAGATGGVFQEARARELHRQLFTEAGQNVYVVLDGASVPELLERLAQDGPEYVCLYRGELEPDLAACAPYLVQLRREAPFTEWVIQQGWGKHWGIFAASPADLKTMRKHFRTFLVVKDPEGKQLYFRYYDPRVLRVYLPTCNAEETAHVFGPVSRFLLEDEAPATLLRFWPEPGPPRQETVKLTQT